MSAKNNTNYNFQEDVGEHEGEAGEERLADLVAQRDAVAEQVRAAALAEAAAEKAAAAGRRHRLVVERP